MSVGKNSDANCEKFGLGTDAESQSDEDADQTKSTFEPLAQNENTDMSLKSHVLRTI